MRTKTISDGLRLERVLLYSSIGTNGMAHNPLVAISEMHLIMGT